jgi:hypothetical protein
MIAKLKKIFYKKSAPKTDFSEFFYNASSSEKKKLLTDVVRRANNDQKNIIEKCNKLQTSASNLRFR